MTPPYPDVGPGGEPECPDMLWISCGPQHVREFMLTAGRSYIIGRASSSRASQPDIDLAPDVGVSRQHARLSFFDGAWWLEDCGSRHGTRVQGKEIQGLARPTRIWTGVEVEMGDTVWTLGASGVLSAEMGDLRVELRAARAVTYALCHCKIPVVTDLVISNSGADQHPPLLISVTLRGYSETWQRRVARILPGDVVAFPTVPLPLDLAKLEGLEGRRTAQLELTIDGVVVLRRDVDILGFYEWPHSPAFRKTLACFVQPAHPMVLSIVAEALNRLPRDVPGLPAPARRGGHARSLPSVEELYRLLADEYDIRYAPRPPSCEWGSQTVRPPHRILPSSRTRSGEATCLDLALFMASCLESMDLQPMVVLVKEDSFVFHAVVGWWALTGERVEPVLTDVDALRTAVKRGTLFLLEPTGITDRFAGTLGRKLTFAEAREHALGAIGEGRFAFAVDVAAARHSVAPLQLPMDEGAIRVLRDAEALARAEGSPRLETRHLAWSLADQGSPRIAEVFRRAGAVPAKPRPAVASPGASSPRPTVNYRRCLDDAKIAATDAGTGFVGWEHLLYAVILSPSRSVDEMLADLGTSRDRLRRVFEGSYAWPALLVQTGVGDVPDDIESGDP